MLCTIAIRRTPTSEPFHAYALRVTGKTALGPSGTGGQDTHEGLSANEVLARLHSLGLSERDLAVAQAILDDPREEGRYVVVAADVQIPFATLEAAEIDLFD